MATAEHHSHARELVAHGIAFCVAAGIGAVVLYHYYWFFEANTETTSAARDTFLTCVVIAGGAGPAITGLFFWLRGIMRPSRGQ